ncbi:MAG: hypothetical protein ACREM3_09660 [Candidatus Rokuibacteriota bacterium]
MLDAYRATLYRLVFALAALYNVGFGLWVGFRPHGFFALFGLEPPRDPSLWACLGMVIGVYGLAYAYAAWRPAAARPFIALGLLGKLLGPAGWMLAVARGELPVRTFPLIVFNDVVWWMPFALFLLEGTRAGASARRLAPHLCAGAHALAAVTMLLVLRPGTEAEPDAARRAAYIAAHPALWRAGWAIWMAAALSLVAFYAWWGARLAPAAWGVAAVAVASAGLAFDLAAESLFVGWLPENLDDIAPVGTLLTGGAANGLYTAAGVILTLGTPALRGGLRVLTWSVWAAGVALAVAVLAGSVAGTIAAMAALMTLFCPWVLLFSRKLP